MPKQEEVNARVRQENRRRDRAHQEQRGEPVNPSSDSSEGGGGDDSNDDGDNDDDEVDASGTAVFDNDYFYAPPELGGAGGTFPPPPLGPPPPGQFACPRPRSRPPPPLRRIPRLVREPASPGDSGDVVPLSGAHGGAHFVAAALRMFGGCASRSSTGA